MLKKTLFALLLVPAFLGSQVQANYYDNSCNSCCDSCLDDWSIYADYLYWRARRCDLDYATPLDVSNGPDAHIADGSVAAVEPCYDSGVRVGIRKECGCTFFGADYTYFNNSEKSRLENADGNIGATRNVSEMSTLVQGEILSARADWDIDYNVVDINMGYYLNDCNRCFSSYIFGGLKFAFIDQEFKYEYLGDATSAVPSVAGKQTVDLDGYGINLGLGMDYTFCGCFSFFGSFSFDTLVGHYDRKTQVRSFVDGAPVDGLVNLKDDCWELVGVANLAIGLGYDYSFDCCCWCGDLNFAIGYEFHQWINQPNFLDVVAELDTYTLSRNSQRLGLDGLFVRVGLGF